MIDVVVLCALIGLGLIQAGVIPASGGDGTFAHRIAHGAVIAASILPLLLRRRFPLVTLVLLAGINGIAGSIGPLLYLNSSAAGHLALLVATFLAAAAARPRLAWVTLALPLAAVTLVIRPWMTPVAAWLPSYPIFVAAFLAGRAEGQRRELNRALEDRLLDIEIYRERLHKLALQRARTGLARDLHDVVAHALQHMGARAQEALRRLGPPPVDPQGALAATETTGRSTLVEMRRLLQVLRADAEGRQDDAQPDLTGLNSLVHDAFPPAVKVRLTVEGDVKGVPPPVALAGYRIVQEALTNARQHSDPRWVEIRLDVRDAELLVQVLNDGRAKSWPTPPDGLGIIGMRERAALFGGTLQAGGGPDGGYSVIARLPFHGIGEHGEADEPFEPQVTPISPARPTPSRLSRIGSLLRRLGRRGWPVDVALVVVLAGGGLLEMRYWRGVLRTAPPPVFSTEAHIWAVALVLLLLFRRKAPVLTAVGIAVMAFLQTYPFGYWTSGGDRWALYIAVYTVGSRWPRRLHVWVVAALGAVGIWAIQPLPLERIGHLAIQTLILGGAAYVGTVVGERRRLIAELEESLRTVAEERRTELALALHQDRLATAREMHDLVAHTLSLMVVQAGAARTVAPTDPEAARKAIQAVIDAGAQSTRELHQLLSLLRGGGDREGLSPSRDIHELVAEARDAGLRVDLQVTGDHPPAAGSTVETFAYRIVQEALTNARKHAPGSSVTMSLRHDPGATVIRVADDGSAGRKDLDATGAGQGLLGMRERVAVVGGRLRAEPNPAGGFVVEAVLPREQVAA